MKRMLALILVCSLIFSGCGFFGSRIKDPVTFYYLCEQYPQDLCCVMVPEEREASGHISDLPYLLALYQMGPVEEELRRPLPAGTRIRSERRENQLLLELSDAAMTLSELDFSLACACLTMTCLDITGAESVTISCGDRTKTMTRSGLTLSDSPEQTEPTEEPA